MFSTQSAGDRNDLTGMKRMRRPQDTISPPMIAPGLVNDIVMSTNELDMASNDIALPKNLTKPSHSSVITDLSWLSFPPRRQHLQLASQVYSFQKRRRRPWEGRIQRGLEAIQSCQVLCGSNSFSPSHPVFITVDRVLFSHLLPQSFIYQHSLLSLGHTYKTMPIWKYATKFGVFEPIGFACVFVNRLDNTVPVLVDFLVLPGSAPPGGVPFMLGANHVTHNPHNSSGLNQHAPQLLPPEQTVAATMLGNSSSPLMVAKGLGGAHGEAEDLPDLSSPPFNQTTDDHDSCLHAPSNDLPSSSTTHEESRILAPLSWKSEFSWHSQRLVLDGEDFPTGQTAKPSSEVSIIRVGGTDDPPRSETTIQEGVPAPGLETMPLQHPVQGESVSLNAERINVLVSLLEKHYWRTHPAKGSTQGNGSQGGWAPTTPVPKRKYAILAAKPRPGAPKKGKGIDNGSGGGDDREEDDEGGTNGMPSQPRSPNQPTGHFACPFLKWDPLRYYSTCKARHRNTSEVISHLRVKHYNLQCAPCDRELSSPEEKNRHLQPHFPVTRRPGDRPAIISEAKWAQINEPLARHRRSESIGQEARWNDIFDILFPTFRDTYGIRPFLDTPEGELLDGLIRFIQEEGLQELRRRHELFGPVDYHIMEQEISAAARLFIPRILPQLVRLYKFRDIGVHEQEIVQGANNVNLPLIAEPGPSLHGRIGGSTAHPRPHEDNQHGMLPPHHHQAASPLGHGSLAITSPTDTSMALTMGTSIPDLAPEAGETPQHLEIDMDWEEQLIKAKPDSDRVEFLSFGTWGQSEVDFFMTDVNLDDNSDPILSPTSMNLDAERLQNYNQLPTLHHGTSKVPPMFPPPNQTNWVPPPSRNGVGGFGQPTPIPAPLASHGAPSTSASRTTGPAHRGPHRTNRSTHRESPIAHRPGGSRTQRQRVPGLNRASSSDVWVADHDSWPVEDPEPNYR